MKLVYKDNISQDSQLDAVKYVHRQFLTHHLTHTVAVTCQGLETNKPLIDYINKTHNWDIQIHGWTDDNYALMPKSRIEDELDKCILKIEELFGVVPERWYLPWNGWTPQNGFDKVSYVADIAIYHGVDVDVDVDHISHFISVLEAGGKPPAPTVYFHHWEEEDLKQLSNLLYLTRKFCKTC